jgi:HAE1 family hydrophobic/amphiphilic exporter-1
LGNAVAGGTIVSTVLSLFAVPILYIVITKLRDRFKSGGKPPSKRQEPTLVASEVVTEKLAKKG